MKRVKTTIAIDERLMRMLRVRAARTGRTLTEVVEDALRDGLSVVDRMRTPREEEGAIVELASAAVNEVRAEQRRRTRRHA